MKALLLILFSIITLSACNSPNAQHNKEIEQKANKLQNISSSPLAPKHDSSVQAVDTSANSKR